MASARNKAYSRQFPTEDQGNVLDLSKRRCSSDISAGDNYQNGYQSPASHTSPQQPADDLRNYSDYANHVYSDVYQSSRSECRSYREESKSETSRSPPASTSSSSPNYSAYYSGNEQFNQYVIQAAFQQQIMLKNKLPLSTSQLAELPSTSPAPPFPIYSMVGKDGKVTRPFKAYPKDPLSLTSAFCGVDGILDEKSAKKYDVFRKTMLDNICAANGGQATVTNPRMRRTVNNNIEVGESISNSDSSYSERRRKNNAAAKKSRDRRRIKEDEIAIRASFLERENIELRFEIASAKRRIETLEAMLPQKS